MVSVLQSTLSRRILFAPSTASFIYNFLIQYNSYICLFQHKKSIYYKIYIQLVKINIIIYNKAIRSLRTKSMILKKTYLYVDVFIFFKR